MRFLFVFLLLLGLCREIRAAAAADAATKQDTEIFSDTFEYDSEARVAIYRGNVRVKDPQMEMTCATLTVRFSGTNESNRATADMNRGQKVESILAEGSVVMSNRQERIQATGEKALYRTETDTVELTGKPQLYNFQGTMYGDIIIWDRRSNKMHGTNVYMKFQGGGTNSPGSLFLPGKVRPDKK